MHQFITSDYCIPQYQQFYIGEGHQDIKAEPNTEWAGQVSKETSCAEDKDFLLVAMSIFRGVLFQQMSTWLFNYEKTKQNKTKTQVMYI